MNGKPLQPEEQTENRLISIAKVAEICGVSIHTVYHWLDKEGLPVHQMPGRRVRPILRIDRQDLDNWLAGHRHDPAQQKQAEPTIRLNGRRYISVHPQNWRGRKTRSTRIAAGGGK